MIHPSIAWLDAVCDRASKEGWEIRLQANVFQWRKDGKEEAELSSPANNIREVLFFACMWLDQKLGWNTSVEVK